MAIEAVDPKSPIPRYYQVYASLRDLIREGVFNIGDPLPAERQLVEDYGVSRITVVKALDILDREGLIERQQGRGNFITKRPIAIDEPERLKVAVFFPYMIQPHQLFNGILRGIGGLEVQLQIVGFYSPSKEPWYVHDALDQGFDGLIFYPVRGFLNKGMYRELIENKVPFVMMDRYHPQIESDYVVFDDYCAGYELTECLIQQGHKKIAVITSHEVSVTSVQERLRGYRQALEDNNLDYDEELVWLDIYRELDTSPASISKLESTYQALDDQVAQYHPTALLAINLTVTEQIMHDLAIIRTKSMGSIDSGSDVGVSDFHVEVAAITNQHPSVSNDFIVALAVQSDEMLGATAMKLLIDRINGTISDAPVAKKIPMEIVDLKSRH